jgi:type 1 glutamine amidotransferase
MRYAWFAAFVGLCFTVSVAPAEDEPGFRRLFNGKNLTGWQSPDMSYWSVEDGAITARCTSEHPCTKKQYLVWANGVLDDFELKLSLRTTGSPKPHGEFLVRGHLQPEGDANGYVVDARQGKPEQWNDYHLIARGKTLQLFVNGQLITETPLTDGFSGVLALQFQSEEPTVAQFKNIRLKRLKLSDGRKKIVFVAGKPSHPAGEHEYNAGCTLLKKCLDKNAPQAQTALYLNGWPADASAFDNADAIMLYMNGGEKHPLVGRNRLAELDALMKQGVGLLCSHFAVEVPKEKGGPEFLNWIGGYYENGFSTNPHWPAKVELDTAHPITHGVKPFEITDEWYFNLRFRENLHGVTSIVRAVPSDETRQGGTSFPRGPFPHIVADKGRTETLMWAVERPEGGRGVGFTGGHFHRNWANNDVRKLMLNALVWTAKLEVPPDGVPSTVTDDDLKQNLDKK